MKYTYVCMGLAVSTIFKVKSTNLNYVGQELYSRLIKSSY